MNNSYLIRIILRARDEVSTVLRAVRQEVDQFGRDMRGGRDDTDGLKDAMNALRSSVDSLRERLGRAGEALDAVRGHTRQARDETDAHTQSVDLSAESVERLSASIDGLVGRVQAQAEATRSTSRVVREDTDATKENAEAKQSMEERARDLDGVLAQLSGRMVQQDTDLGKLADSINKVRQGYRQLANAADIVDDRDAFESFSDRLHFADTLHQEVVQNLKIESALRDEAEKEEIRRETARHVASLQREEDDRREEARNIRELERRTTEEDRAARAAWARDLRYANEKDAHRAREEREKDAQRAREERAEERAQTKRLSFVEELFDHVQDYYDEREKFARDLADYEIREEARVAANRRAFEQSRGPRDVALNEGMVAPGARVDATGTDYAGRRRVSIDSPELNAARAEVDTSKADKALDLLNARLARYARQLVTAKADAEIGGAQRKIALLEAELMALGMSRTEVKIQVDESINNARNQMRGLTDEVGNSLGFWDRFGQRMQQNSLQVSALSSALRGMVIFAAIAFAQQLLSTVTALAGSLVAVASSAIQAGFALGGAFAAGAAQAIPAVGLLVAAFARVKSVSDAVGQSDLVRQQQAAQGEARDRRAAGATDQLANAQDGLVSALESVSDARRRVTDAERAHVRAQEAELDALRNLSDARREARRELQDMALAARGAALSQEEAQAALRRAVAAGDTSDIASRQLDVDESTLRANRTRVDNTRAQSGGVNAMPQVQQAADGLERAREQVADTRRGIADALRGVDQAQRAVDRARRGIDAARRQAEGAGEDQLASVGKLNYMLAQLSGAERNLYTAFQRIRKSYEENIRPITDIMVGSFAGAVDDVNGIITNADWLSSLRGVSEALAEEIDRTMEVATNGRSMRQYQLLMDESADNTKTLGAVFRNTFRVFLDIAEAASPALRVILGYIKDITTDWREFTSSAEDQNKMRDFFLEGAEHLRSWMRLLGATIQLFGALMGASSDSGQTIIEDLTVKIQEATRWIEDHQVEVRKFFDDARVATYAVMEVLWELSKAIMRVFDPDSVRSLADFMTKVIIPIFESLIKHLGRITTAIMEILSLPGVSTVVRLVAELFILRRIFTIIATLMFTMRVGMKGLMADMALLAGSGAALKGAFATIPLAIAGVGAALKTLLATGSIAAATKAFRDFRAASAGAAAAGAAGGVVPAGRRGSTTGTGGRQTTQTTTSGTGTRTTTVVPPIVGGRSNAPDPGAPDQPQQRTRRQRVARGVGIAALVGGGAAALSQGQTDFRGVDPFSVSSDLDSVSSTFQKLTSLDIGGFFKSFGGWTRGANKDFKEFGETADESFKKAVASRNEKGLRDLAKQARDMADKFPQAAEALNKFAEGSEQAADGVKKVMDRLKPLSRELRDNFLKQRLRPEDILNPAAVEDVLRRVKAIDKAGTSSIRDIRFMMEANIDAISQAFARGTPSWRKAMEDNFGTGIANLRASMKSGRISVKDGMEEIRKITRTQMRYMRDNMDNLSREGRERLASNFSDAAKSIRYQMDKGRISTREGMKEIRKLMSANLKLYGYDESQIAGLLKNEERGKGPQGLPGGKPASDIAGAAVGGFLGLPGERGADGTAGHIMGHPVGRGEAVVFNAGQQGIINNALQAQYGYNLPQMFKKFRSQHAGESPGGFARGGIVGVPGFPGERAASYILDEIQMVAKRFGLRLTDAFGPGHKSPGHTVRGDAADFAGPDRAMDRAVRYLVSKGYVVGYDGRFGSQRWSGHGPTSVAGNNAHLHVEFGRKDAGAGGGDPLGFAGAAPRLKRVLAKGIDRSSPFGKIAQGALNATRKGAQRRLDQIAAASDVMGAEGMEEATSGKGRLSPAEVQQIIGRAMVLAGVPMDVRAAWRPMAFRRARQESGFDPNIQNNWDSNAKNGDPSRGLFQTIGATFRAHVLPNMRNILNPLHNAVAAFRYMFANYGSGKSWNQALSRMLSREGIGYEKGGAVPGYGGGDQHEAKLEGGEHVITKEEVRAAGGHGAIYALRKALGGGAQSLGRKLAQGGEFIGHTPTEVIGNITNIRGYAETTPAGIFAQIQTLRRYMDRLKTTGENYARGLRELARLGESFTEAVTRTVARARANLARSRYSIVDGVVVNNRDADEQRAAESRMDAQERRRISRRLATERGQLEDVNERMEGRRGDLLSDAQIDRYKRRQQELEKGKENDAQKKELAHIERRMKLATTGQKAYDALVAERNRLMDSIADGDSAIATYLENEYNRQRDAIDAMTTKVATDASRRNAVLDIRQRLGELLGRVDIIADIPAQRIASIRQNIADLGPALAEATRTGNTDLADAIRDQMRDLEASITEIVVGQFEASIEAINNTASRTLGRLDLARRMLDATGTIGADARDGIYARRGDALAVQRDALAGKLAEAARIYGENSTKVDDLRYQIEELDVTIQENSREAFLSRIEAARSNAEFKTSMNSLRQRILTLKGEISGNFDEKAMEALLAKQAKNIKNERGDLEDLLDEARDRDDEQAERDLERALLENEIAQLENTKAMKELNGTLGKTQSFQTSAWLQFRQAIFNGSGGLLPQYDLIPKMDTGGRILKDGLIYGHAGEAIKPALVSREKVGDVREGDINIEVESHASTFDYDYLARRIMFERSTAR